MSIPFPKRLRVVLGRVCVCTAFWACLTGGRALAAEHRITVVFRYDDYANGSPDELERRLLDAFGSRGIPATFAVIPFTTPMLDGKRDVDAVVPLTPDKVTLLQGAVQSGLIEPALHGYVHTRHTDGGGRPSELMGLPLEEQCRKLAEGKRLLDREWKTNVTTLVPPYNGYDANTLEACADTGLHVLSAQPLYLPAREATDGAGSSSAVSLLHYSCELPGLRQSVECARESGDEAPIIVVLMHPSDFIDVYGDAGFVTFEEFVSILDWVATQPDIRTATLKDVAAARDDLTLACFLRWRAALNNRFAPRWLYADRFTPSGKAVLRALAISGRWIVASCVGGLLVSAGIGVVVGARLVGKRRLAVLVLTVAAVGVAAGLALYVARTVTVRAPVLLSLACLFGLCLGSVLGAWRTFRRPAAEEKASPA